MPNRQQIHVNGSVHPLSQDPDQSLLSFLREDLDLTGAKYGCGEGQCGACTVLIDGQPTRSCITPAASVGDRQVLTIEGVTTGGKLHPVQEAFLEADAMQCGYCSSGMVLAAVALLQQNADPSEAQIVQAMEGNICRCGTYRRVVRAIRAAAQAQRRGNR